MGLSSDGDTARTGYDKGRRTQTRITQRGSDLFAAHGYGGTSMEQVARAAGLTKGAIYAHFQRKRDLWTACLRHSLACIAVAPQPAAPEPRERLVELLTWLGETLATSATTRSFLLQVIRERSDDPEVLSVVREVLDDTYTALRGAVRDATSNVDADAFAFIAFSALLLDPDLHRFHALMTGHEEPFHSLDVTVQQLVDSVTS